VTHSSASLTGERSPSLYARRSRGTAPTHVARPGHDRGESIRTLSSGGLAKIGPGDERDAARIRPARRWPGAQTVKVVINCLRDGDLFKGT
jgi:hypothetical protein